MAATMLPAGLVILRSPAGCGKSTFANWLTSDANVDHSAIISTDAIRAELTGDAADQSVNAKVFALRDARVESRLREGLPTVADSMHLRPSTIKGLVKIARATGASVSVVDCAVPFRVACERNANRIRVVPEDVIVRQFKAYEEHSHDEFLAAGADVVVFADDVVGWAPAGVDGSHLRGPFDIIGDVHGQLGTLAELLAKLGYDHDLVHPDGRIPVFVGDLVDKGPDSIAVLDLVMDAHRKGRALMVRGNHEHKLARRLSKIDAVAKDAGGRRLLLSEEGLHGTDPRVSVFMDLVSDPRTKTGFSGLIRWITRLPTHLILDGGALVVVHSAIRASDVGVTEFPSNSARNRAEGWQLYGPSTGRKDASGNPERIDWVPAWDGDQFVVRGHVTVPSPEIRNRVASVDVGAGDGAALAAFHWPSKEFTSCEITAVQSP